MAVREISADAIAPSPLREIAPADIVAGEPPTLAPPVPQMEGFGREAALPASNLAKGGLIGVGLPGDLLRSALGLYSKYIGAPFAGAVTGHPVEPFSGHNAIDSETLLDAGRKIGFVDRPDLVPQTQREKLEAGAAQGVGAVLPLAAIGGPAALPRAVAQGAGAGVGSELGKELFPGHPIAAPLIGGLLGGGAGNVAYSGAARVANAARGVTSPIVGAYDRLGINPELAGDVSQNPTVQQIQAFATKAPGGAGRMEAAGNRVVGQFGDAVERTAANLGVARTESQAGQTLQAEARDWVDNVFPQRQAQAWAPVDRAVAGAAVPLDNYRDTLGQVTQHLGRLQASGQLLIPPRAQQLLQAINTDLPAGAPATWQEAQRLRSLIGEARGVPEIAQTIGDRNLGRIYGALSEDMRATAAANGAQDAFQAANAVSTAGHSFIRNVLGKIFSSPNPAQEAIRPEQAAKTILNGGDSTLTAVRAELPQAADELAAFKLRDMAQATPGAQNAVGDLNSPRTFLTDLSRLRQSSPAGSQALFADPHAAQAIEDLATVAHSIRQTAARLNTSNTGPHSTLAAIGAGIAPAAWAGHEMGGVPGALAAVGSEIAMPFAAANAAARLTSNERLARLLATPIDPPAPILSNGLASLMASYPALSRNQTPALPRP